MTDTDLPALARAVAERLGCRVEFGWADRGSLNRGPVRLSWFYSPEGAFWLFGQMYQQDEVTRLAFADQAVGIDSATLPFERVAMFLALTPEVILRAAATALGVETR